LAISRAKLKELSCDMNLDGQKAKPAPFTGASDPSIVHPGAGESGKAAIEFKEAAFVVYPAHGVGQILSIEEQTVAGASLEFLVIYFTKRKMTLRVPARKAANLRMRKLSELSTVQRVKKILAEASRRGRGHWSRLAQEYETKINSGDIVAVAEVARDLFRPNVSSQSFSERQLYVLALDRLCEEIALVEGISEEQAVKDIEGLIKAGTPKQSDQGLI
jgi:CarD family transcriptional regulator, regulator of rRNA transcription